MISSKEKITFEKKYYEFELQVDGLKYPVACSLKSPKNINNMHTLVLFVNGLYGTKGMLHYVPEKLEDAILVTYDARGINANKNKNTRNWQTHLKDLIKIIQTLKRDFAVYGVKQIILCGESFGAAITTLYYFLYGYKHDDVCGYMAWNMPKKLVDIIKTSRWQRYKIFNKLLWSLITDLPTYQKISNVNFTLINNQILKTFAKPKKLENKDTRNMLAAWLATRKAWTQIFIAKNKTKIIHPFIYISSADDALIDLEQTKHLDVFLKTNLQIQNLIHLHFLQGKHCLLIDDTSRVLLLNIMNWFAQYNYINNQTKLNQQKLNLEQIITDYYANLVKNQNNK